MPDNPEQLPPRRSSSKRLWWLLALVVTGLLLGGGYVFKKWQTMMSHAAKQNVPVFTGGSGHWDQSEVPISLQCGACHEKEFREWADSDHAWAFRKLDSKWDAEPFQQVKLKAHGSELTFATDASGHRSVHDGESGKSWAARWATGRTPLVQYLVPADDGGFHTLSASWDVNKKEWFDIFNQEERSSADWGHWRGRGMNWNSQCAWCHMSEFSKNYDFRKDRYASTWKEPGVTCIQCHGPLLDHPEAGTGCMIATGKKLAASRIKDNCASCHARRDELDDKFRAGDRFDDHFSLVLPVHEGVFWPNGMQRDEDYCETGLRLSKMGKAGVTCIDCHDPHTGKLKLPQEDNSLCMRCHATSEKVNGIAAPLIDPDKHSPCPPGSKGHRCVECHMPESLYMARDPRRDHSFNSPDPALSIELGIPNACTMCHKDKDDRWAAREVERFYGPNPKMAAYRDRTRAVQQAYEGKAGALPGLLAALKREENPGWRATILGILADWRDTVDVQQAARLALHDEDALVRAKAAAIVEGAGMQEALAPLLEDPLKLVRLEAAWALRDSLDPSSGAFRELAQTSLYQSDQPPGAMKMATLEAVHGNLEAADEWYRKAIKWDATSAVAYRDYAVFLSSHGKPAEAFEYMEKAVKLAPGNAGMWYLLGLAAAEMGNSGRALEAFGQAVRHDALFLRAYYNRALLLHSQGRMDEAVADLLYCIKTDPDNADYPYLLAVIYYKHGDKENAVVYAAEALRRNSSHQDARILLQQASQ